jgi:hypothetical protein
VIELNEPQIWVLIGVFATAIFGMIGIVTTNFNRSLTSAIGGLHAEIVGVRSEIMGSVQSEIGSVRS